MHTRQMLELKLLQLWALCEMDDALEESAEKVGDVWREEFGKGDPAQEEWAAGYLVAYKERAAAALDSNRLAVRRLAGLDQPRSLRDVVARGL